MKGLALLLLILPAVAALPLSGEVSGQVDLFSRYIWRGFDLLPENHAAIQPALTIVLGKSGFSLNVWSSFALARRDVFRYSDEIDLTIEYACKMPEGWELRVGFIHYGYWFAKDFKFRDHTTQEAFAAVAATDLSMTPELCLYYDFNLGSGLYATLGVSREWRLHEKLNLEVGGLVGFNSRQYIDKTGFSDIDLYARLPLTAGRLTLTPSLNVMIPLLDAVNTETEIWFGFSAAL